MRLRGGQADLEAAKAASELAKAAKGGQATLEAAWRPSRRPGDLRGGQAALEAAKAAKGGQAVRGAQLGGQFGRCAGAAGRLPGRERTKIERLIKISSFFILKESRR